MGKNTFVKAIILLCMGLANVSAAAKLLPLSPQGQKNEQMYMNMLQGFLAADKEVAEACAYYERAAALDPTNKFIRRQLMLCALDQNQLQKADEYADFIEQEPNDSDDLSSYAFYQWRKGDIAAAQSYYEQALQQMPDDSHALYQYVILLSSFDVDRAAHELQSRRDLLPELGPALDYETGNLYLRHKKWEQALHYYQMALDKRPNYAEPRLAKAEIYEKTSQFFLMMHELEELEKMGYESAPMYTRMGSFYVLVKEEARAKHYFEKARELDPSNNVAGYFLAVYAEQAGEVEKAAQYLRETAGYPKDASKWLQVSIYQQQAGDMKGALETLSEAYKRFDQNVEIGYFYALLLQDSGKYRRSAEVLRSILQTNPTYEQARLAYAFALEGCKRYEQMEEQIKLILARNPSNAAAYNLLGFSLAERNIRLDEAQEAVVKALSLRPMDRSFIDSLAWVYYRQGKYEESIKLLKSVGESFIENTPEVMYHLGAAYVAIGDKAQAKHYLEPAAKTIKPAAKLLKKISR